MKRWMLVGVAQASDDEKELRLYRRDEEFSIRVGNRELMNSRAHGSEDALAELACARISDCPRPRVLIGGLGMGYTLRAALQGLSAKGRVIVAELIPEVVEWNRGPLGALAGHPLRDDRVAVREVDVAGILRAEQGAYDAILLDVDNGPRGLTRNENDWLYGRSGLSAAFETLRPGGVLAVWSAGPDRAFGDRLRKTGFKVEEVRARARAARLTTETQRAQSEQGRNQKTNSVHRRGAEIAEKNAEKKTAIQPHMLDRISRNCTLVAQRKEEVRARSRAARGGSLHTIWIAGRAAQSAEQELPAR